MHSAQHSTANSISANSLTSDSTSSHSNHRTNGAESRNDDQRTKNKYYHHSEQEEEWSNGDRKHSDLVVNNLSSDDVANRRTSSHRISKRTNSVHSTPSNSNGNVNNLNHPAASLGEQANDDSKLENLNQRNLKNQSTFYHSHLSINNSEQQQFNRPANDGVYQPISSTQPRTKKNNNNKMNSHYYLESNHHLDTNLNSISNHLDSLASSSNHQPNYNNASDLYISKLNLDTKLYNYGIIECYAENEIGIQDEPCIYQIIPAGNLFYFF